MRVYQYIFSKISDADFLLNSHLNGAGQSMERNPLLKSSRKYDKISKKDIERLYKWRLK